LTYKTIILTSVALLAASSVTAQTQATCAIQAGFSPEGSAAELVLKNIESAHHSIRLAAYTFTSPDVVQGLVDAKERGVDVQVVADEKGNKGRTATASLNRLVNAGIPVRSVSAYPIHHDKYIVIDGRTVETGSFNYTRSAAGKNSENVIVISDCPALAGEYLEHWQSRWVEGAEYQPY